MQSKKRKYYRRRNLFAKGGSYNDIDIDIDITKSGPLGFRQLQELNRQAYENRYNMGFTPEYIQFLEDNASLFYPESPSLGLQLSANKPIVSDQALQGKPFGSSRHDDFRELSRRGFDEGLNVGDIRAQNQPWWEQLIHGIAKSVITAGTTYANAVVGGALGILEMPYYALKGADAATVLSRRWDNEFAHAMKGVQDWAEKALPNYYTQAELDDPWYKHINANFIGDKVIKNLGFTVGEIAGGATGVGVLNTVSKAIQVARGVKAITGTSRIVSNVVGSVLAGTDEAATEALQNAEAYRKDASMERGDQIDQDCKKALDALEEEMRGRLSDLEDKYSADKPHDIKRENGIESSSKTGVGKSTLTDETLDEYTQEYNALQQEYQRRKQEIEDYYQDAKDKMQSRIDHDAIRLGNTIMAVEAPMIMLTDAVAWGSVFSRGYATHTATSTIMHHLPNKLAAGLTFAGEAATEGGQEYLQDFVANATEIYYDSGLDDFYTSRFDPDSEKRTTNAIKALAQGWVQTAEDPNSWESFFIGSLTKFTGVAVPRTYRNSEGKLRAKISFEGNIYTDTKEYLQQLRERDKLEQRAVQVINNSNLIQSTASALNSDDYFERQQEGFAKPDTPPKSSDFLRIFRKKGSKEILREGSNKFNYENASHKRLLNLITLYSKLGRINELKERVSSMADNLTDEDINSLVTNSTVIFDKQGNQIKEEDVKGQEVIYKGPFVDEQGNRLSNDEIRQALQDKKQAIFNTIDHYRKIAKAVDIRYGGRLNIDDLQEVVWLESQLQNWGNRAESMAGDIKSVIDDALGVIQDDIDAVQTIIDSTEEESKEHKQAVEDLAANQIVYNNLMKFGRMSEKKLARKLSLRQDIHGNLDNSAYNAVLTIFEAINKLKETGNLSEKYNEQDLNDILVKLKDLVVLGKLRQAFMAKLYNYLSKPTEIEQKKLDEERKAQEKKDNEKVQGIKDSLSKATSLKEFRDAVRENTGDTKLLNKAIDELEKDGNTLARNYKKTDSYRSAVTKAIDDSNASDTEKQDAKTVFRSQYNRAETIDELSSPEYRQAESATEFADMYRGSTPSIGEGSHVGFVDASGKAVTGTIVDSNVTQGNDDGFLLAADSDPEHPTFVSWEEAQAGSIRNLQSSEEEINERYAGASMVLGNAKREVNARDEWKDLFDTPQPAPAASPTPTRDSSSKDGSDPIDPVNPATGATPGGPQPGVGTTIPVGGETTSKKDADNKRDKDNRGTDDKLNQDNAARTSNRSSENNRPYYRPAIPYHNLSMLLQHKVVPFIDVQKTPEGWRLIWNYLTNNGAFSFVDAGNLHAGDEIGFMIDPQYEAEKQSSTTYGGNKNTLTIFMVTKDGRVVGSLDENFTEKFQGLTELRQQIEEEYNKNKDKLGENQKFTSSLKTHVNQMMTGHLAYNYDESDPNKERSLAAIPGVLNSDGTTNAIFGIMKGGVLETNGALDATEIVTPIGGDEGALYLMVPTGAGVYIPSRVTVAHFNKEEYNLSDETVKSTPLGKRIDGLLRQLIPTVSEYGSSTNVTKEKVKEILSNLNNVLFTRDIILNYEEREDGIYLKFGHKVYDKNGNPVLTESGKTQLTNNRDIKLASRVLTSVNGQDNTVSTGTVLSWRRDAEDLFNEILNEFYSYNVPLQVSVNFINKSSGGNSYNERLIKSGVLTSNLISAEQQGQGTWFTTNPIVNGKEIKGTAPKKLGVTAATHQNSTLNATEANPVGGTDSARPRSWMPITSVNTGKVYNVDMNSGKIYDAAGKEVSLSSRNTSLLRDLAKANQLYGDNTEGASMSGNIMIIEDTTSPYSTGTYRVLDRTRQTYLTGNEAQEVINRILGIKPTQAQVQTSKDAGTNSRNPSVETSIYDNSIEELNPVNSTSKITIDGNELSNGKVGYFVIKKDPKNPEDLGEVHKGVIYDLGEKGNTGLHVGIVKVTTTEQVPADIGGGETVIMEQTLDNYYAVFPNGNTYPIITHTANKNAAREAIERITNSSESGTVQLSNAKTAITDFFENYKQNIENPESQETIKEETPKEETTEQPTTPPASQEATSTKDEKSINDWLEETSDEEDEEFANYERKEGEKEATATSPTVDGNTLNPDFVPEVGKEYGIEAVEALFNKEIGNSRGARTTKALANKVFALARRLGLKIVFDNSLRANNPGRYSSKGTITFSHRFFTRMEANDKANVLLHEVIHACTQYVLSDKMKEELNKPRNKDLKEAVDILNETYAELKANKSLSKQYGMKNVKEMVAEMSNPEFRRALRGTSLWERFKAGIKRLFGIKTTDSNYTKISAALNTILDSYNPALYEAYVKFADTQEAVEISDLVRRDLKGDRDLTIFYDRYKNDKVINKKGEIETRKTKKGEIKEIHIVDLIEQIPQANGIDILNKILLRLVDDMFSYCSRIPCTVALTRVSTELAALIAQDRDQAEAVIAEVNRRHPERHVEFKTDVSEYTTEEKEIIQEVLQEQLTTYRQHRIDEWANKIVNLSIDNQEVTPAEQYAIVKSLIKFCLHESEASPIEFLDPQFRDTIRKMRFSSDKNAFNFYKEYVKTLSEEMGDPNTEVIEVHSNNGLSGKWVRINNQSVSLDIGTSIAKLQALSRGTDWCTRTFGAQSVLQTFDRPFYAFIPNEQTTAYIGVVPIQKGTDLKALKSNYAGIFHRFQNKVKTNEFDINALEAIETLSRETKDPNVKYTLENLGYSGITEEEKEALKQERRKIFQELKDKKEFTIEDIEDLGKLGFPVISNGNKIGLSALNETIIDNIKNLSSIEKQDIINKLLHSPTFTFIEGDLGIRRGSESHSPIQDTGNLEYVGGNVILENISISSKLKRIDGNAELSNSDPSNIEYIGGDLMLENSKLVSLGNLRYIGGTFHIPETLESLGELTFVGWDLRVNSYRRNRVLDFNKLETVGRHLEIDGYGHSSIVNLRNLKRVGGFLECNYATCNAPQLEFVGKDCKVEVGDLRSLQYIGGDARLGYSRYTDFGYVHIGSSDILLDALTYIGGDALLGTKAQKLDNLEFVGGFLSLIAPNVQKLHKDLIVEKALILINPTKEQREDTFFEDFRRRSNTPIIGLNIGEIEQLKKVHKLEKKVKRQLDRIDYLSAIDAFEDDELLFEQEKKIREVLEAELKMADIWGIHHLKTIITGLTARAVDNQTWNNLSESTRQKLKEKGYNSNMFRLPQEFVSHIMKCCGV